MKANISFESEEFDDGGIDEATMVNGIMRMLQRRHYDDSGDALPGFLVVHAALEIAITSNTLVRTDATFQHMLHYIHWLCHAVCSLWEAESEEQERLLLAFNAICDLTTVWASPHNFPDDGIAANG